MRFRTGTLSGASNVSRERTPPAKATRMTCRVLRSEPGQAEASGAAPRRAALANAPAPPLSSARRVGRRGFIARLLSSIGLVFRMRNQRIDHGGRTAGGIAQGRRAGRELPSGRGAAEQALEQAADPGLGVADLLL